LHALFLVLLLLLLLQVAERQESVVNQAAIDLLRRLPGVTDSNWRSIINGCSSLRQLTELNVQQLEELMGSNRGARMLHDFLHAPCPVAQSFSTIGGA
jgi:ERCC4-type nuclease